MYSDSTHFVYEILQNADDHGATEVCFKLSKNEIVIEHNGENRLPRKMLKQSLTLVKALAATIS